MRKPVVHLKNVSKRYQLIHQGTSFLDRINLVPKKEELLALDKVNLKIYKGERIGIVGPNGSGKTTLLKIISGITAPSEGRVRLLGRVVSLINLEGGFHPELTGGENIYLNGALIGMSKEEIKRKFKYIVELSGIGEFIDVPFYTYSDGMKFRLALAVGLARESEVLIFDEIFIAADLQFQRRISSILKKIQRKKGMTTIVVSHSPILVWEYSEVFFAMKKGKLRPLSLSNFHKMVEKRSKLLGKTMGSLRGRNVK